MRPLPLTTPPPGCRLCGAQDDQRDIGRERYLDWGQSLIRCGQCGGAYLSPDLTPEALNEFYAQHFRRLYTIDLGSEMHEALANWRANRLIARLPPGGRVLEIGSGTGHFLAALHRLRPDLILTAIEPDHANRQKNLGKAVVRFVTDGELASEAPYDLVALFHVLEHLPAPLVALQNWATLLTPAGRIVIEVPDCRAPWTSWTNVHVAHVSYFTLPSLLRLLHRASLQPCQDQNNHRAPHHCLWLEAQAGGSITPSTASAAEIADFDAHLWRHRWTARDAVRTRLRRLALTLFGADAVTAWQVRKHQPAWQRSLAGPPPRQNFAGIGIDGLTMAETLDRIRHAITQRQLLRHGDVNVAKLIQARDDRQLAADLARCDIVSADGMGIVWGARWLGLAIPERVTGIDLMMEVLAICAVQGWRPYFLGAQPEVLAQAIDKLRTRFPTLSLAGSHHGYFSPADEPALVEAIAASGADCLFVAMSSPLKERFLAQHGDRLTVPFTMGVGGALDVVAGLRWRAPGWMQRLGLEWVARLIQEPLRLGPRYLITNSRFAWLLWRQRRP